MEKRDSFVEIQHMLSSLQERGRGSGGYYGGDDPFWDYYHDASGNIYGFGEEVIVTPDVVDYDEYDWSFLGDGYDTSYDERCGGGTNYQKTESDYIQDGLHCINQIESGNAPIIMDEKSQQILSLTSTGITAHEIALEAIQEVAKDSKELATIGKFANGIGIAGAAIGVVVAYQDLTDGHRTPQDWGQAVGAGLGLTATILGLTVSAPISVPIGIGAMIITFFSYTLDDSADHQQTKY